MVAQLGMSDRLGAVSYEHQRSGQFLDTGAVPERAPHAETTAQQIDEEVRRIIDGAHEMARSILRQYRHALDGLTQELLQKEVIEASGLRALLIAHGVPFVETQPLHEQLAPEEAPEPVAADR
jgi:cell division protease FtsH